MKPRDTDCPVTKVASLMSDTWTMLIMHTLLAKPRHFCELERELEGISTRTLTLKLAKLTDDGLIRKNKEGGYEATERGKGLRLVISAMRRYEERYL